MNFVHYSSNHCNLSHSHSPCLLDVAPKYAFVSYRIVCCYN
jgi:hypothetical protein